MKSFFRRQVLSILGLLAIALIPVLAPGSNIQVADPEARAQDGKVLHGHVPAAVGHLQPIGRPLATTRLHLTFGLPLRNQDELGQLIHELYDPSSPNYRHFLTQEEFTERFGPTEKDFQAVIDFAKANGLSVVEAHANRIVLVVEGSVGDIEKMLHVTLRTFQHPKEARTFYAPDAEPALDLAVPILHISGLDNYARRVPRMKRMPANVTANAIPRAGTGPSSTYIGNDFRTAYVPGTSLTGSNQSVGLLQFDGYYPADIATYTNTAGIHPSTILTNVPVGGGVSSPGAGNGEVSLDIQMVMSMAPGLSKIYVFEAPNDNSVSWAQILSAMASNTVCKQFSCSWGDNAAGSPDPVSEVIFQQMGAQGQSFFNATGDTNSFPVGAIPFPSESTNITQVGGTTLTTGSGATYSSETVWRWNIYSGSSGGVSGNYTIPSYQLGIANWTANLGSTSMRNVPDVALTADNVYNVADNGVSKGAVGGTSCAAPLWAGFTALVNEQLNKQAGTNGLSVGFLNPAIYTIGKGASYSNCFHDITSGNNYSTSSSTRYPAVSGYDLCTGWGTPNGTNLINALAGAVADGQISVSPSSGLASTGYVGGAFSPASQVYSMSNTGGSNLNWTVSNAANWLTLSATSGALAVGASTNITVSINSNANSLTAGTYSDTVGFTNASNGDGNTTRSVSLTVKAVAPSLAASGWALTAESCSPANGLVDPGETVTVSLAVTNAGNASTANLVGTLSATGGVTSPSSAQTYGAVAAGGTTSKSFTFTASGTCGSTITATLQLQDGSTNYGNVTYTIPLGQIATPLSQNFDGVTAPALPAGWATSTSGAQSNWVTSATSADTSPNAAFSADNLAIGVNELDTPVISIVSTSAVLTFRHNYSLTASTTNSTIGYDGGVLEIKIGTGPYADILSAGGSFASAGYNTTLSSGYSNPLAGRQAWSGSSGGFTTTVVNLPAAAAGQNVQLRWRCGAGSPPTSPYVVRPLDSSGTLAFWNFDSGTMSAATCLVPNYTNSYITVTSSGSFTPANGAAFYTGSGGGGFLSTGPFVTGNPTYAVSGKSWSTSTGTITTSTPCWTFALTVSNGMQAGLSSFSFDDRASTSGPQDFVVQISQQSNFSSVIFDSGATATHSGFTTTPMNTFTLSNTGLTGTVYFRIYGYAATSATGTWRVDNVNVQGSVASTGPGGPGGWYIDTVSVSDPSCCSGTTLAPVALFTGTPTNGTAPLNVSFTDSSTGTPTGWEWDFGDGNTSTARNPSNTYAAGTWTVRLIASNAGGSSTNTKANYITVLTPFQSWQNHYWAGGASDPNAAPDLDPYGKGFSNTNQFLAGFNPTDTATYPHIINIVTTNNDVNVIYLGANGDNTYAPGITSRTNVLDYTVGDASGNYANGGWQDTGRTNILSDGNGSGIVTNMTDSGGATNVPSRFYRIRVLLP